jgi:hypothetical protein
VKIRSESVPLGKNVPNPFRKMANTRLYIDEKKKTKKGFVSVYCLVHIENKTIKINTGVSVALDRFDKVKGWVRGNDKHHKGELFASLCYFILPPKTSNSFSAPQTWPA